MILGYDICKHVDDISARHEDLYWPSYILKWRRAVFHAACVKWKYPERDKSNIRVILDFGVQQENADNPNVVTKFGSDALPPQKNDPLSFLTLPKKKE